MWNLTPSFLYIRIRATHCHRHCNPDLFSYLIDGGVVSTGNFLQRGIGAYVLSLHGITPCYIERLSFL